MKTHTKRILSMLLAAAMMFSLAACSSGSGDNNSKEPQNSSNVSQPSEGDSTGTVPGSVLNVVVNADMPVLTPMNNMNASGYMISVNVYEGLVRSKMGDWSDMQPCLAESWEISDDGLEYVFHLRQGVTFHDGSTFDAKDVIATFDYMKEKQPSYFTSIGSYEATDDYTVAVHMTAPYAYFINILGSLWFRMLSAEALGEYGDTDIRCAVGTGPFYIEANKTGECIITKAYQDYWDKDNIARIETVNYNIITDSNTAFMSLQSGQNDVLTFATALQYTTAQADPGLSTYEIINPCNWILGINSTVAPLDKIEVRKAIDMCIDKEAVNQAGFDGLGFATNSTYVEESGVYADMGHVYDPEGAVELLASVGVKPSDISLTLTCSTGSAQKAMAENVQAQLMNVGMKIDLITMDDGPANETRVTGNFELNLWDTGGNLYNPLGSISQMFISEGVVACAYFTKTLPDFQKQADEEYVKAASCATGAEATALGQKLVEEYQTMYPWIPLVGGYLYHLTSARTHGVLFDPGMGGYAHFQYAYVD